MRFKILLTVFMVMSLCGSVSGQATGKWQLLHDSELDTLTGVAADSILNTVDLKRSGGMFSGQVTPRVLLIVDQVADISGGEGLTVRQGMRVDAANSTETFINAAGIDTIFASPGLVDVWTVINTLTNPGEFYRYSQKAYTSAADTDSLTHRRFIYAQY